jgi:hypothetical protein
MRRPTQVSLAGPARAAPMLGLVLGITLVLTFPNRAAPLWLVWAPLALAVSTAAGAVFAYGLRRWAELVALHPVRVRDVAVPLTAIATFSLLAVNVTDILSGPARGNWRNAVLVTLALLAGLPAAGVIFGVRYAACSEQLSRTLGGRLALLVALRRLLQRLVVPVGSLVALTTLATSALVALERSVHSQYGNRPPQYVLIFGGFGSLLVALFYVPAWAALRDQGHRLCDELFPMECLDEASAILSRAGDRQKLEQILEVGSNVLADMQTGLVILTPLLASAAASFLPH